MTWLACARQEYVVLVDNVIFAVKKIVLADKNTVIADNDMVVTDKSALRNENILCLNQQ